MKTRSPGSRSQWETLRVVAAVTRPFLVPARSWKERREQLEFALDLEMGKVAA